MINDKYITLEINQLKLVNCERELGILEDPNFRVWASTYNINRARRNHRSMIRHLKRNIKRLIAVVEKQSITRAEDNIVALQHAKITKHYNGFIVMAHGYDDYKSKCLKIQKGDTRGFYTIEQALKIIK
jgi:hypothetical protein